MHSDRCSKHHTCAVYFKRVLCASGYRMCICAHVRAICSFGIGERGWGGSTSL